MGAFRIMFTDDASHVQTWIGYCGHWYILRIRKPVPTGVALIELVADWCFEKICKGELPYWLCEVVLDSLESSGLER
ncbi:MAG: hypothetical protein ACPL7O_08455 [Armatimonadota bacterium]